MISQASYQLTENNKADNRLKYYVKQATYLPAIMSSYAGLEVVQLIIQLWLWIASLQLEQEVLMQQQAEHAHLTVHCGCGCIPRGS